MSKLFLIALICLSILNANAQFTTTTRKQSNLVQLTTTTGKPSNNFFQFSTTTRKPLRVEETTSIKTVCSDGQVCHNG